MAMLSLPPIPGQDGFRVEFPFDPDMSFPNKEKLISSQFELM